MGVAPGAATTEAGSAASGRRARRARTRPGHGTEGAVATDGEIRPEDWPAHVRRELAPPRRLLDVGHRGSEVARVQEWLSHQGFGTAVDGAYGPATARCVRDFQRARGIEPDGRVDGALWQRLVRPLRAVLARPGRAPSASRPFAAAVLDVAERHLAEHPIEIGGANRGPWVRLYCNGADGSAWAWCAGFVSFLVAQAAAERGEAVPFAGSVSCDTLAAQGREGELFVSGKTFARERRAQDRLAAGCVFLRRRTPTDWVHAGLAYDFSEEPLGRARSARRIAVFRTVEGNTNDDGSRDGYEACRRTRSLAGDHYDFIALEAAPGDGGG